MRLWHKELIEVLPQQQLVAQWREILAIKGAIEKKGTPNHLLVNKMLKYNIDNFYSFAVLVTDEFEIRGYKYSEIKFKELESFCKGYTDQLAALDKNEIFIGWHDERYLHQCYYNLEEKYDCGGMKKEEYLRIAKRYIEVLEG